MAEERAIFTPEIEQNVSCLRQEIEREVSGKRAFALEAENSLDTYVKFLSLARSGHAVLPCPPYQFHDPEYRAFLGAETRTDFIFCAKGQRISEAAASAMFAQAVHPVIESEMRQGASPLILRTSGSSGKKYKYVLHDYRRFLEKFSKLQPHYERTLAFSPFESVAGIEALTEAVCHRRTLVAAGDRLDPPAVSRLISKHGIDFFQTTPTFLNLMRLSGVLTRQCVPPLRKIAYGSEPSSRATLEAIRRDLPEVELMHTYGMTEIGILRTQTRLSDPSVFALDERYNPGRLSKGMLEVKSMSPMVGYLNAEFETTPDGWFRTGDRAEESDAYLRVLGRADDTINVAGRKFFPSELEELIMGMKGVADVIVEREKNDLIGEAIVAQIVLGSKEESEAAFRARFKEHCESRIPYFMRPHRILIRDGNLANSRFKKVRRR